MYSDPFALIEENASLKARNRYFFDLFNQERAINAALATAVEASHGAHHTATVHCYMRVESLEGIARDLRTLTQARTVKLTANKTAKLVLIGIVIGGFATIGALLTAIALYDTPKNASTYIGVDSTTSISSQGGPGTSGNPSTTSTESQPSTNQ